jgi:hypothetical protein
MSSLFTRCISFRDWVNGFTGVFHFACVDGFFVTTLFCFCSVVGKLNFPEVVHLAELADSLLRTQRVLGFIVQIFIPQVAREYQITIEIT